MEVHAHSHTERKKWSHYFWEFFMLFLAVTLGFFVENRREHYVEHLREKEYAKSLYDDLTIDTATIQRTIDEKKWIKAKFDSAQQILDSGDLINNNEFIYYVERYITLNDVFTSQDVTYQQLRSSGNFRYISNVGLYKKIADYYNLYSRYQDVDGSFGTINKNELINIEAKIFDPKALADLDNYEPTTFYDLVLPPKKKLHPMSTDKESLKLLYLHFSNAKYRSGSSMVLLTWLKRKAVEIMKELKKEYHLK
jgi:hypothetical protein